MYNRVKILKKQQEKRINKAHINSQTIYSAEDLLSNYQLKELSLLIKISDQRFHTFPSLAREDGSEAHEILPSLNLL